MTNVNNLNNAPVAIAQTAADSKAATNNASAPAVTDDAHGPAVTLDLSPAAQAAASAPATSTTDTAATDTASTPTQAAASDSSDTDSTTSSAAPAGGGGVSFTEVSADVSGTKRRVAAEVGVVEANFLVDSKANIDHIGLAEALQKQQVHA